MDTALDFSQLYRQHSAAVFRLAWVLNGDRTEAEDLTAETFARALAANSRIEQATVRSYLYAIVRHLVASARRRPRHEVSDNDGEAEAAAITPEPGPEQRADLRERLGQVRDGLDALPDGERQVLLLFGVHGLDTGEIADALGLEPGHVRVRLHRARRHLIALIPKETSNGPA